MRFCELPYRLRLYILAHPLLLAILIQVILLRAQPIDPWLVVALLFFTVVFSTWKIELTILQARMTLTFAVVCLGLLLQGLPTAALCAGVGALVGTLARPADRPWRIRLGGTPFHRLLFNVANCMGACIVGGLAYEGIMRVASAGELTVVLGLTAFTATYFAINTLGVSFAIANQQQLPWFRVWQQNFLWTAPGFFASACASAGIQVAFSRFGAWSLLFLPPLYLIHYSYRLYMERLHLYSEKLRQEMERIRELNELNQAIIASLATAIDAKDRYTCSHVNRVQRYAVALAEAAGISGPALDAIATGALVHDIGKLGIPDHILSKPGKLAPEEFRRIQSHVTIGTEILSPIPFPFPVVDVVRSHHERWDGLGYPGGLRGEEIPIGGRIIALVDVYDALISNRPYRRALTHEAAIGVLREQTGRQFDPDLVERFVAVLPKVHAEIELLESAHATEAADAKAPRDGASALTQISQAAAEMAAVCDVAHSLAEHETLEQITRVIVNRALALLPADTVVLYLRAANEIDLIATAVEGQHCSKLEGMTIEMGEGVAGWVATNQQALVNVSAALDIARRFAPEETMELSAATAVPLLHGPDVLGVLAVYTLGYCVLTEHHLHLLNILAEHAAAAIQNTRRFEQQRELAYSDPLTGLANSRSLVRHLERLTFPSTLPEPRVANEFSVVMLDLDRFKEVNDTLGHLRGDELLRLVAQTLRSVARPGDVVCRYAGDEFVLLIPNSNWEQADSVAGRLREAIESLPEVDGRVKIGASLGAATYPNDGTEGRALLHTADCRMYEDKFRRRQACEFGEGDPTPVVGA